MPPINVIKKSCIKERNQISLCWHRGELNLSDSQLNIVKLFSTPDIQAKFVTCQKVILFLS